MPITISKSQFMSGVQCLKRLYFQVHEPEHGVLPDAAAVAIMEQGSEVGRLARQLFAGGVEVSSRDPEQAIRITHELIANPEIPAIFEAAFEDGGVFVRVDILQRRRDNRWRLIEVKSTTDLKEHHLDDVAIQHRVVSRCGLDLASSSLAHINRNYVFDGGSIDVRRFFKIRNLTRRIENHVYHPAFAGSYSLKAVLPALVPEMSYAGMQVADGQAAGIAWESLVRGGMDKVAQEKARKALVDYCGQDTFALVRLTQQLQSSAANTLSRNIAQSVSKL